jgi:hypothetical protein
MSRALFAVAFFSLGCVHSVKPHQIITIDVSLLMEARQYVQTVKKHMPEWDADYVGQFERAEIAEVNGDVRVCEAESDPEKFLDDANQLMIDAEALLALDKSLQNRNVI